MAAPKRGRGSDGARLRGTEESGAWPRKCQGLGLWRWTDWGSYPALPSTSSPCAFPSAGLSFSILKVGVTFRTVIGDHGSPALRTAGPQLRVAKIRRWLKTTVLLSLRFCGRTRLAGLLRGWSRLGSATLLASGGLGGSPGGYRGDPEEAGPLSSPSCLPQGLCSSPASSGRTAGLCLLHLGPPQSARWGRPPS